MPSNEQVAIWILLTLFEPDDLGLGLDNDRSFFYRSRL